ncbi:DNA-dependent ATPase mgs1 [Coemansia sp. RSA 2559]|nr:DNA-dependent ATPase mgs1 [Coemansia sp. RSA 2559]
MVPEWYVSDHLDRECSGMQAIPRDDLAAADDAPKRTPSKRPATMFLASPASQKQREAHVDSTTTSASGNGGDVVTPSAMSQPSERKEAEKRLRNKQLPLAERLRPLTLESFVGQQELVGSQEGGGGEGGGGGLLRSLIDRDQITSMIFWGSPGLGKTTLARIIARRTRAAFKEMSAVTQNIADVRKVIEEAGNLSRLSGRRTILFLDEIHRFNKAQQDIFLPYLERGQIILIGATTENPSFKLNSALLSRCRVLRLEPLSGPEISQIAVRAAKLKQEDRGMEPTGLEQDIASYIASVSNGDARVAINVVDIAMNALPSDRVLSLDCIRQALQRTHVVYGEEEHYDLISALHKSVRGSDANAALYWLGRMLQGGDDPLFVARRLVRMASEDIGLADNSALGLAISTFHACQAIGMPECDTILAHCVTYLARAPKSIETYKAFNKVKSVLEGEHPWPVPLHLRNAPTRMMKDMGYAEGYKYNPDYDGPVDQEYLPDEIKHYDFFGDVLTSQKPSEP